VTIGVMSMEHLHGDEDGRRSKHEDKSL